MEEKKKSKVGLIVFLIILVLGLAGYICYDKLFAKDEPVKVEKKECKENSKEADCDCNIKSGGQIRTYRFFGYDYDKDPDMYTTLKLNSDGEYNLYLNGCNAIAKYTGIYKETDEKIILTGDYEIEFTKTNDGNELKFDKNKLYTCDVVSGSFSLEDYMLNNTSYLGD